MSATYGGGTLPPGSGTNTFLQWTGTVYQWAAATSGGIDGSGNVASGAAVLLWPISVSPQLSQATATSDVATASLRFSPQPAFASAVTHLASGNVWCDLASPASGTTQANEATFHITRGGSGTPVWDLAYGPAIGGQFGSVAAGMWAFGNNSTTNWALAANATTTYLNGSNIAGISVGGTPAIKCQTSVLFGLPLQGNGTTPIALNPGTVAVTTTTTVSSGATYLKFTGTLAGNCTVILPSNDGTPWYLDFTAIVFATHTITIQANSVNWGTTVSAAGIFHVIYNSASGKLWGHTLTL